MKNLNRILKANTSLKLMKISEVRNEDTENQYIQSFCSIKVDDMNTFNFCSLHMNGYLTYKNYKGINNNVVVSRYKLSGNCIILYLNNNIVMYITFSDVTRTSIKDAFTGNEIEFYINNNTALYNFTTSVLSRMRISGDSFRCRADRYITELKEGYFCEKYNLYTFK